MEQAQQLLHQWMESKDFWWQSILLTFLIAATFIMWSLAFGAFLAARRKRKDKKRTKEAIYQTYQETFRRMENDKEKITEEKGKEAMDVFVSYLDLFRIKGIFIAPSNRPFWEAWKHGTVEIVRSYDQEKIQNGAVPEVKYIHDSQKLVSIRAEVGEEDNVTIAFPVSHNKRIELTFVPQELEFHEYLRIMMLALFYRFFTSCEKYTVKRLNDDHVKSVMDRIEDKLCYTITIAPVAGHVEIEKLKLFYAKTWWPEVRAALESMSGQSWADRHIEEYEHIAIYLWVRLMNFHYGEDDRNRWRLVAFSHLMRGWNV
ncbi:MAG: hypothetical protein WC045_00115 [Patescibacteria group bacterium]